MAAGGKLFVGTRLREVQAWGSGLVNTLPVILMASLLGDTLA